MKKTLILAFSIIIVLIITGILITGCSDTNKTSGIYEGVLPCADCEGIQAVLELNSSGFFKLEETYLGEDDSLFITEGKWSVDDSGKITLAEEGGQIYFKVVSDKEIKMLDRSGNDIESELNYSLFKK